MWIVSSLQAVARSFEFSSTGEPLLEDMSLEADGVMLVNMVSRASWAEDPTQVLVCDGCGQAGCSGGGCVAVRRLGGFIVFAPSHGYASTDEFEQSEYGLPWPILRRGEVPLIPVQEWERVRSAGAGLPPLGSIKAITWSETFLIAQFEAPHRILGSTGQRPERPLEAVVVATDPWMDREQLARLGSAGEWARRPNPPSLRRTDFRPVTVVLEEPLEALELFAEADGAFGLLLRPGLAVFAAPSPSPRSTRAV